MTSVVELIRTSDGPTHLALNLTNGTDGTVSAVVGLWLLKDPQVLANSGLLVTPGGYQAPETNATGAPLGCVALPIRPATLCESRSGGTTLAALTLDTVSRNDVRRIVLAFVGDARLFSVGLARESRGWQLRRIARRVGIKRTQDIEGTYVITSSESIEHFRRTSLRGGTRGSLATAALPCRPIGDSASTGSGYAQLTGGPSTIQMGCPDGRVLASSTTSRGTRWQLEGDVYGTTYAGRPVDGSAQLIAPAAEDIRLLVVDGPF